MCRHHCVQTERNQAPIGQQVIALDVAQAPLIHWQGVMRIGFDIAMSRKMLADTGHARRLHAGHERGRQHAHHLGTGGKSTIADDTTAAIVQIEHWRETEVDTIPQQLSREYVTY